MYVRWQWRYQVRDIDRQFRRHYRRELPHGRAVLVESFRVDGKPNQRHVAYLGSVHLAFTGDGSGTTTKQDVHYRAWWWHRMNARLNALGNRIPAEDRPRIEAALAEKVPNDVTAAEVEAYDLEHQRKRREEYGECRGCYLNWPEGQAGVPPRPEFPEVTERWANVIAAVAGTT